MQSMIALKVTRVVEDRDSNNLVLSFDGAGLTLFCSYKLSPQELTVDDLIGAKIVEVDEYDNEFQLTFDNSARLLIVDSSPERFIDSPEAFIYTNKHMSPPLYVVSEFKSMVLN